MKQICSFLLLFLPILLIGQSNITGYITDQSDQPLPGVSIVEKGTSNGTISGVDGKYSISFPANGVLLYSYIGFQTQEIEVAGKTVINVQLNPGVYLEEVVLVGSRIAPRSSLDNSLLNIVLKDSPNNGVASIRTGITSKGDGE